MESNVKSKYGLLAEKLMYKRRNANQVIGKEEISNAHEFCEGYKRYLNAAKTERESVKEIIKQAKANGFTLYDRNKKYNAYDKIYSVNRGKYIILAIIGKNGLKNGASIIVSHHDSPRLDIKPNPLYEDSDLALLKTHYYGGIKKYQWTTVPLSLHGKVVLKDGSEIEISIGESDGDPQFCVTDLLIHAAKDQMEKNAAKLILGEELNIIIGSTPYSDDNASELVKLNVLNILNEKYGIIEEDFLSAEIEAVPAHKATDVGLDRSMVGAYGQDDRVCAYASFESIFGCDKPETTSIVVMTDKEEIGSEGNTGLNSDYLRYFVSDLAKSEGLCHEHVLSASSCLSADVTAAFDPTWSSAYEKNNASFVNYGVSICKYTGSGGKSGASDCSAEFLGKIRKLLNDNNIPWQVSEITKVDGGGGGTVSKFVAGMNIDVLDMGVAVLSMHSPFELVSKVDVYLLYKAFLKFFK